VRAAAKMCPLTLAFTMTSGLCAASGRPDLNRRPLDPQECIHKTVASINIRLCRSGGARASKLKQLSAPLSRTRSHSRSHPCTWQRQASGARFAIRNADLFGSAASPTVRQPSLRDVTGGFGRAQIRSFCSVTASAIFTGSLALSRCLRFGVAYFCWLDVDLAGRAGQWQGDLAFG
jgi:hypothetical protein